MTISYVQTKCNSILYIYIHKMQQLFLQRSNLIFLHSTRTDFCENAQFFSQREILYVKVLLLRACSILEWAAIFTCMYVRTVCMYSTRNMYSVFLWIPPVTFLHVGKYKRYTELLSHILFGIILNKTGWGDLQKHTVNELYIYGDAQKNDRQKRKVLSGAIRML